MQGLPSCLMRTSSMEELTAELPMLALTFTRKARPAFTIAPFFSPCYHLALLQRSSIETCV